MEWVSGNIFIRPNEMMKAGDVIEGHAHNFDHTSFVVNGAVNVRATTPDGRQLDANFGNGYPFRHFLVLKDVEHTITALEDGTDFYCIYSHREPQGDIVQTVTGWTEAYQ